ncbi:integrase, catalytic region, zinc finger, CCHC-type containing protein [Tanacetum coccineum]
MAKASPTQAWLWHRCLSHLNFDTINLLCKNDIVKGLPKLKYVNDQLCSSCEMGKAKRNTFQTKTISSSNGRLHWLHMDLCGPMRFAQLEHLKGAQSLNGKHEIAGRIIKVSLITDHVEAQDTREKVDKQGAPNKLLGADGNSTRRSSLEEDNHVPSTDTRPPMLDRTDFASWQQQIRLYCQGKENGHSSNKLNFKVYKRPSNSLINHYTDAKDIWDNVKMLLEGSELTKEDRESQLCSWLWESTEQVGMLIRVNSRQDKAIDEDVEEANRFQDLALMRKRCFKQMTMMPYESDVDELLRQNNVHDHDHYQDAVCDHHEEHEMHDNVQPNHVVDSHADYTSDSNMTPYDQYVKDNVVPVVQNNASMVPNDAYVMIDNDVHESERRPGFELTEREQKIDETTKNSLSVTVILRKRNLKK